MSSSFNPRLLSRKAHRWGAILVALPFLVVIATGILLQLKKHWTWVQPAEQRGAGPVPQVEFARLLAIAQSVPEAGIATWDDVDRIDVRPGKGILKITSMSRWELQVDVQSGAVLHSAYRRSDWLESLHDGSWFHPVAKLGIFLPSGIIVLGLWLTGIYLWIIPYQTRRKRERLAAGEPPRRRPGRPAREQRRPA